MQPVERSQSSSLSASNWINSLVYGFRAWVRKEVVADDPWDVETLYPQPLLKSAKVEPLNPE